MTLERPYTKFKLAILCYFPIFCFTNIFIFLWPQTYGKLIRYPYSLIATFKFRKCPESSSNRHSSQTCQNDALSSNKDTPCCIEPTSLFATRVFKVWRQFLFRHQFSDISSRRNTTEKKAVNRYECDCVG